MKKTILALAGVAVLCVVLVLLLGGWDFPGASDSGEAASPGESGFADATGSDASNYSMSEEPSEPETGSGQSPVQQQVLFPESPPEGFELKWGRRYKDGECDFLWFKEGEAMTTSLNLYFNRKNDTSKEDWELLKTEPYEQTEREVNGMSVHCWQSDWTSQLLWRFNRVPYSIVSKGPDRLTVEELLELVEGMTLFDEIDSFLTQDDLLE